MATAPWVAKVQIRLDGVLAHDVGHEVPDDNVTLYGWQDLVVRADSKTAAALPTTTV